MGFGASGKTAETCLRLASCESTGSRLLALTLSSLPGETMMMATVPSFHLPFLSLFEQDHVSWGEDKTYIVIGQVSAALVGL